MTLGNAFRVTHAARALGFVVLSRERAQTESSDDRTQLRVTSDAHGLRNCEDDSLETFAHIADLSRRDCERWDKS